MAVQNVKAMLAGLAKAKLSDKQQATVKKFIVKSNKGIALTPKELATAKKLASSFNVSAANATKRSAARFASKITPEQFAVKLAQMYDTDKTAAGKFLADALRSSRIMPS